VIITVPQAKIKNHPKVAFGAIFADKAVLFQTVLVRPVVLAEAVRFELTEDFHPRQFSRLVHSTALPSFPFVAPSIIRKFMA